MSDTARLKPISQVPAWRNPRVRGAVFQLLALGMVVGVGWVLFQNTLTNMEKRGITTGFDFLFEESGFGILMSLIEFDETHSYGRTFFVGLLNTILVSVMGVILATALGFVMGVARLSSNWLISKMAAVYIETFRNIPLLLQIFFWYFSVLAALPSPRNAINLGDWLFIHLRGVNMPGPVPQDGFGYVTVAFLLAIVGAIWLKRWSDKRLDDTGQTFPAIWAGFGLVIGVPLVVFGLAGAPLTWEMSTLTGLNFRGGITIIPELIALWLALSIYTAAFIAEIVRSGILAVSHGQTEAARALGLRNGPTLRLIVIPQSLRVIIPPLTSQYLNLIKNSSLATAIGYPDLVAVFMGTTLNQVGQAVEIVAMTMGVYLTLSLSVSAFMNWYNKRIALVER